MNYPVKEKDEEKIEKAGEIIDKVASEWEPYKTMGIRHGEIEDIVVMCERIIFELEKLEQLIKQTKNEIDTDIYNKDYMNTMPDGFNI